MCLQLLNVRKLKWFLLFFFCAIYFILNITVRPVIAPLSLTEVLPQKKIELCFTNSVTGLRCT